jgi:transposase
MAKTQVEVITSVERRRRWSSAEKERLVAASLEPGAVVSAVAREAGLHPSQLHKWRRHLCARQGTASGFALVRISAETAAGGLPAPVGALSPRRCHLWRVRFPANLANHA